MAYIYKRNKKWSAQVSWYDSQNKRRYKTKSGFGTKRQAQMWANQNEVAKETGAISDKDPVFADYYNDWYRTYREPGKTKTTIERYKVIHDKLKKYFGQTKISKITRHDYQLFITNYGENHSKDTVYKTSGTIRACVHDAMADGIIHRDFTSRVNLTWNSSRTRKIDYLNLEELRKLKKGLLEGISPQHVSRYELLTAMYTGMRPGEIAVLTWKDIDFKNNTISVNKSFNYDLGKVEDYVHDNINKSTKNVSSTRIITVNPKLLDLLKQLKANGHERIFIDRVGTIPTSTSVNKVLRAVLKKEGINKPSFHFHSLRHSHVALLLFAGVPLYAISKRLGHASMTTTANRYAYLIDELKQKSDSKILKALDQI